MSDHLQTPVVRLTAALNEVADALASADLPRLLAAEPRLGDALDAMNAAGADRSSLEQARSALLRCRRLGAGLASFTRLALDPDGMNAYSRTGAAPVGAPDVRSGSMEARG